MSYSRFGCDGSDVYIYHDVGGYLRCCWCPMLGPGQSFDTPLRSKMIEHIDKHTHAHGHHVPPSVKEALLREINFYGHDDINAESESPQSGEEGKR